MTASKRPMFGNDKGEPQLYLDRHQGITYKSDPLMFFIALARYKFAARHLKKTDRVLEGGCGQGTGAVMLAKFARQVDAADYDADLMAVCEKEYADVPNLRFVTADLLSGEGLEREAYDAVVSLDVIEHFTEADGPRVLANLASVLRPGGVAVIGTPNKASGPWASKLRKESHLIEYGPAEFDALLAPVFPRRMVYSMTDEVVSTSFAPLSWYLMAVAWR